MARVHAFADDALGDLDTVGLVEHLALGKVSIPEVVDAAIARTEQVAGPLNALAAECFDRARAEAPDPRGGFFAGVPTFVKDNSDLAGLPTMQGTDAFAPRPAKRDGDFARMFLATGLIPLGKTQLSEYGFSAVAEHPRIGPVRNPWSTDHTAGASSSGSAALVAAGAVTARPRQRRRRLDPHPGRRQRPGRTQADPGPAGPGRHAAQDAGPGRRRRRGHPLGPRHRGVPARGREGLPRPAASPPSATSPAPDEPAAGSPWSPTASASPPAPRSPT